LTGFDLKLLIVYFDRSCHLIPRN